MTRPDPVRSPEPPGHELRRSEARKAVLSAWHVNCDPADCYRAEEVETLLLALERAGYTLVFHSRSIDPDGQPLAYCATCFMDWPCRFAPKVRAAVQHPTPAAQEG